MFRLPAKERIKSRKTVESVFSEGSTWSSFPLRAVYLLKKEQEGNVQVAVSVPKKHFKKATDRNRIKRLLRETYRLQKNVLLEQVKERKLLLQLFFIYTGKEIPEYGNLELVMKKCLDSFCKKIQEP
jgi:ribonuclease P protein component